MGIRQEDTGIYTTERIPLDNDPDNQKRIEDLSLHWSDLDGILARSEKQIASILEYTEKVMDGKAEWPKCAAPVGRVRDDALYARGHLRRLRRELDSGNTRKAVAAAFWLGQLTERLDVRLCEGLAKIGKDDQKRRSDGGKSRRALKTDEELQRCYDLIDEYRGPRVSSTEVTRRVSAELSKELKRDISARTVKRIWNERDKA